MQVASTVTKIFKSIDSFLNFKKKSAQIWGQ